MKAGETAQIGNLFWVANCKSLLKGPPVAEVLDGPPGLSVSVVPQKIVPHIANCANPVDGGVLAVSAPAEMNQKTEGRLAIRIVYHTIDGDRQMGRVLAVLVIPADGKEQK